jgi:hypothetical protein
MTNQQQKQRQPRIPFGSAQGRLSITVVRCAGDLAQDDRDWVGFVAFPGLKIQTWGTQLRAD